MKHTANRKHNIIKTIFIILVLFTLIRLIVYLGIAYILDSSPNRKDDIRIDTAYGDSFTVSYFGRWQHTTIYDNNSDFYLVLHREIDDDGIVGLCNTSTLKAYRADSEVFYDDGSGFVYFDGDLDVNTELTQVIKCSLLCNYFFFNENIKYFINNDIYKDEMKRMLNCIINGSYSQLYNYGLTDEVINDTSSIEHMKEKASKLLTLL